MEENGKKNGKTNGSETHDLEQVAEENREMVAEKKNGNGNGKATGKAQASPKKADEGKKGSGEKVTPFTAKPVPAAIKGIATAIEKVTDTEDLKAVARVLQKHWKKVHLDACKKATEDLKAGNAVWFKKGSKLIEGKVVKIKSNGKVKVDVDGKAWKVAGTLVHKGKPTATDRVEAKGSEVTKKAA